MLEKFQSTFQLLVISLSLQTHTYSKQILNSNVSRKYNSGQPAPGFLNIFLQLFDFHSSALNLPWFSLPLSFIIIDGELLILLCAPLSISQSETIQNLLNKLNVASLARCKLYCFQSASCTLYCFLTRQLYTLLFPLQLAVNLMFPVQLAVNFIVSCPDRCKLNCFLSRQL